MKRVFCVNRQQSERHLPLLQQQGQAAQNELERHRPLAHTPPAGGGKNDAARPQFIAVIRIANSYRSAARLILVLLTVGGNVHV